MAIYSTEMDSTSPLAILTQVMILHLLVAAVVASAASAAYPTLVEWVEDILDILSDEESTPVAVFRVMVFCMSNPILDRSLQ